MKAILGRTAALLACMAALPSPADARLAVRAREADPRREIPPLGWAYAGSKGIKLQPEGSRFEPGLIYEFRYPARDPGVLGIGCRPWRLFPQRPHVRPARASHPESATRLRSGSPRRDAACATTSRWG